MAYRVLIVSADSPFLRVLAPVLRSRGFEVSQAASGHQAIELLARERVDMIVLDTRVDDVDLVGEVDRHHPDVAVVVVTRDHAPDSLLRVAGATLEQGWERRFHLRGPVGLADFAGVSRVSQGIRAAISRCAQSTDTVLVTGERGTPKELVARAIHDLGDRPRGSFVSVNCVAQVDALAELGLLAGTGTPRGGLFERARGGTLFLDDLCGAPLLVRQALLRLIQEEAPLGVRWIIGADRDRDESETLRRTLVELFKRLALVHVHLPPLRERAEDIPLVAWRLFEAHCQNTGRRLEGIAPDVLAVLLLYPFPLNEYELSDIMEQAAALASGPRIELRDLPAYLVSCAQATLQISARTEPKTLAEIEREAIVASITLHRGDLQLPAQDLGISRTTLWRRIRKFGIGF